MTHYLLPGTPAALWWALRNPLTLHVILCLSIKASRCELFDRASACCEWVGTSSLNVHSNSKMSTSRTVSISWADDIKEFKRKKNKKEDTFPPDFCRWKFGLNHNSKEHHHGMDSVFVDGAFILCDKCTFSGKMPRKVCMHSRFYRTLHVSATGSSTSGDTLHYHSSVSIPK